MSLGDVRRSEATEGEREAVYSQRRVVCDKCDDTSFELYEGAERFGYRPIYSRVCRYCDRGFEILEGREVRRQAAEDQGKQRRRPNRRRLPSFEHIGDDA